MMILQSHMDTYALFRTILLICSLAIFSNYGFGQEVTLPYSQNFDSGTSTGSPGTLPTNWINFNEGSTDNCDHGNTFCRDWGVRSGGTPSSNTGPSSDNTTGSGRYVYMEASGNTGNSEALLITPSFNLSGSSANLDFFVHNYNGSNSNSHTLEIRVANAGLTAYIGGVLLSLTETNVNSWVSQQVDLSSFSGNGNIRVVFRWVNGGGGSNHWQHDLAVDDVSISLSATVETCDNGSDDDGDGLIDCLDDDCDADGYCDNDSDSVTDRLDYDDDNDGIPDALECHSGNNLVTNGSFENGNTGFASDFSFVTCTNDCGPLSDLNRGEYAIDDDACGCGAQSGGVQEWEGQAVEGDSLMILNFETSGTDDLWRQTITLTAYTEYSFSVWVRNISFTNRNDPEIQLGTSTSGGSPYTIIGTSGSITEAQGWTLVGFNFVTDASTSVTLVIQNANNGNNGFDLAIDDISLVLADCDFDGDGVVDRFDLDSDNDGIYDVFESSSGQSQSGGVLTGGVDGVGIPSSVSNGASFIDYTPADSDNDGVLDHVQLESDGDGCYDSFEEQIDDLDNDGIAGTGVPSVNSDGLVTSITYATPTLNTWQNFDEDNPGCDGDTDDDGIPDIEDLDDDNDGIPDVIESPASIDFSGTRSFLAGTGSLTDLDVGDIVLYSLAIRDCDDIFYDVVITITALSTNSTAVAEDTGINLDGTATPADDRFVTFTISVVETGSATPTNTTGTVATITDFVLQQRDIDSNSGVDATEVVGFSNVTAPDSFYFDPLTVIEEGGFVNGGGPAGSHTYFRMIMLGGGTNGWSNNSGFTTPDDEAAVFLYYSSFSSVDVVFGQTGSSTSSGARFTRFAGSKECDRDGDGVPNRVDLDLDNDGIYDLYEAGHTFITDADGDGIIDGSDTGSGANGLYDNVETSAESGNINYTYSDSDMDGVVYDFFESDSDDDNCFDTQEADVADADVDGIAGTGVPVVDAYGRVTSITYFEPPTDHWQDPLESCLEICDNDMDDDGDGLTDEFDPDCANYFLEAECGFPGANWERTFDIDASNNDYQTITTGLNSLDVAPTAAADILRFTITISAAGTYRILGRVNSASGADDSFWFRVDEGTWYKWNDWDTGGTWTWIEFSDNDNGNTPVRYTLGLGNHSIDIAYREDGAGIDKLHLTINGSTPAGEGEESINCERYITTNLFLQYKIRNRN